MEKLKIITPVGLSLFTNFFDPEKGKGDDASKQHFNKLKNKRADDYDKNKTRIKRLKENERLLEFALSENACAEVTSIKKIESAFPGNKYEQLEVCFLPSDTILSKLAAEIISENNILENQCDRVGKITVESFIKGLQIESEQDFIQNGMKSLIERIDNFVQSDQEQNNLVLNITGGYKATVPYLTIIGQIYNIPLYYIFEETSGKSTQLIRIPQSPIDINLGLFEKYSHIFKQLEAGVYDWENFQETYYYETDELVVHSCIDVFEIDGEKVAELSPIGKIFWNRYNNFYSVKVLAGSNYFSENDKTNVNKSIRELCRRLEDIFRNKKTDELESYFLHMHDKDIKHVRIGTGNNLSQVYKHSNPQIRLHYIIEFSDTGYSLKIINFRYRRDNAGYSEELTNDYKSITEHRYTTIAIRK